MFNHHFTGVSGGLFTIVAAIVAYLSHPNPALQNAASILAIIVGTATLVNIIRKWNR
jgi:hypothetical protein